MKPRRGIVRLVHDPKRTVTPTQETRHAEESSAEQNFKREEAFHPNPYLGFNHNTLAVHLMERGAYPIAEAELRRAIYLNPYEPKFKAHLAWCLHKMGRADEAQTWMSEAQEQAPGDPYVQEFLQLISGSRIA